MTQRARPPVTQRARPPVTQRARPPDGSWAGFPWQHPPRERESARGSLASCGSRRSRRSRRMRRSRRSRRSRRPHMCQEERPSPTDLRFPLPNPASGSPCRAEYTLRILAVFTTPHLKLFCHGNSLSKRTSPLQINHGKSRLSL